MTNTHPVGILLVEDDDVDVLLVKRGLEQARILNPLTHVHDGIEALEILRSDKVQQPFIVLLDLNMPRMGGLEFLEEIRRDDVLKSLVVFVLTTSKADKDISAAYDKQIAGYIPKANVGPGFLNMLELLGAYWKVVSLPE